MQNKNQNVILLDQREFLQAQPFMVKWKISADKRDMVLFCLVMEEKSYSSTSQSQYLFNFTCSCFYLKSIKMISLPKVSTGSLFLLAETRWATSYSRYLRRMPSIPQSTSRLPDSFRACRGRPGTAGWGPTKTLRTKAYDFTSLSKTSHGRDSRGAFQSCDHSEHRAAKTFWW